MPRWNGTRWLYPTSHLLKEDVRRFFDDLIPNDADYTTAFHGYEYRLGLIQERKQDASGAYRALSGEYIGERGWDHSGVPLAEIEFRRAFHRDPASPWTVYLGIDDLDATLAAYREVIKTYQRWG